MSIEPSAIEIRRLTAVARRELGDAAIRGLSADGSFEHAYVGASADGSVIGFITADGTIRWYRTAAR